jgi:asparagine synthase (glutamine-hydrolysing)
MSAIAGWVHRGRDLSREDAVLRAMVGAMAARGPDEEGIWRGEHALLGFRRLVAGTSDTGAQPFEVHADGRLLGAVVFDGEVYNAGELRADLTGRGHRFTGGAVAELLFHAYLEWGSGFVTRLVGMYAIALWDEREQQAILVRDRVGLKPLFYAETEAGAVFASERKALLVHPWLRAVVDADGLRELMAYAGTPGHAVFKGMRAVKPASFVRIGATGISEHQYWAPETREHEDDMDATVATVRGLLEQTMSLPTFAVPDVLLSGGVDSSTLTAFVSRRPPEGASVRTYTVRFGDDREEFQANEVWHSPDLPYVREMVDACHTDHTEIVLRTADLLDPLARTAVLRAKEIPNPLGNMNTSYYLFLREVGRRTSSVLQGDGADSFFGGMGWVHHPGVVKSKNLPWVALAALDAGAPTAGLGGGMLKPGLLDKLDIPGYSAQRYRETVSQVEHLPGESDTERVMRDLFMIHLKNWLGTLLPHDETIAMSAGLEMRLPFTDHRLTEYVYNIPWSMKTRDKREKGLLRAAVADLLPQSILDRQKSPYPVPQDAGYPAALCAELSRMISRPDTAISEFVDSDAVRETAANPAALWPGDKVSAGQAWAKRSHVEMLLQLDEWISTYGVSVEV